MPTGALLPFLFVGWVVSLLTYISFTLSRCQPLTVFYEGMGHEKYNHRYHDVKTPELVGLPPKSPLGVRLRYTLQFVTVVRFPHHLHRRIERGCNMIVSFIGRP